MVKNKKIKKNKKIVKIVKMTVLLIILGLKLNCKCLLKIVLICCSFVNGFVLDIKLNLFNLIKLKIIIIIMIMIIITPKKQWIIKFKLFDVYYVMLKAIGVMISHHDIEKVVILSN